MSETAPHCELHVGIERLPMKAPFRISGYTFTEAEVVSVTLTSNGKTGRGEANGVYYLDDAPAGMVEQIEALRLKIEAGVSREALQSLLPRGGARNALDCALWELDAQQRGVTPFALAEVRDPKPLRTTFTLGADEPAKMAQGALMFDQAKALKLKLTGDVGLDIERVRAVRAARPDVWMGVDGNQGFSLDGLQRLLPALVDSSVKLVEQPLPRGREADLDGFERTIPFAADESVQDLAEVASLVGRFDVVNIKLDKCGGLTEGLRMAREARRLGLKVMVGCMSGSSLAMAPAFVLGQLCDLVDLDAPTFLAKDRRPSVTYADGDIWSGEDVWGSGPSN